MTRGRIKNGMVLLDSSEEFPEGAEVYVELAEPVHNGSAVMLLNEWLQDDSGYDEETWPQLKMDLDAHRLSSRRLFDA